MKRILFAIIALFVTLAASATDYFKDYEGKPDCQTIFVSKAMLKMVGPMLKDNSDIDMASLASSLESIQMLICPPKQMKAAYKKFVDNPSFELLSRVTDGDEKVFVGLIKQKGNSSGGKQLNDYVVYVEDTDECVLIVLTGTMTEKDVLNATARVSQ